MLPELAERILEVGSTGYGLLAAAVPAGALLASAPIYRMMDRWASGHAVLWATAWSGAACIVLSQSPEFVFTVAAAFAVGWADASWSTVQQAAIQLEAPDAIRGRVSSLHQLVARDGPSLGNANGGDDRWAIAPVAVLSVGGLVPIAAAATVAAFGAPVRRHRAPTSTGEDNQ